MSAPERAPRARLAPHERRDDTITLREAFVRAMRDLKRAGVDAPALDARLMLLEAAGLALEAFYSAPDRRLDADARARFEAMLARRLAREPLAYILGRRAFWRFTLAVGPDVLVPRPESETLVEAVLDGVSDKAESLRILDLGTGSGCLLLALLAAFPHAVGLGVDISARALLVARANAERLGLAARAAFVCGDWHDALSGAFDIVVANAPYIPSREIERLAPEIRLHEPRLALDGGADGLSAYRRVAAGLAGIVRAGGLVALEVGEGQAHAVENLLACAGFAQFVRKTDLAGEIRVIVARQGTDGTGSKNSVGRPPSKS